MRNHVRALLAHHFATILVVFSPLPAMVATAQEVVPEFDAQGCVPESPPPSPCPAPLGGGIKDKAFHAYRVPDLDSRRARRDLEFLWSDTYLQQGRPLDVAYGGLSETELTRFGKTICDQFGQNAFGFNFLNIQIVYDYLNLRRPAFNRPDLYNLNPNSITGFKTPHVCYPDSDVTHADTY